MAASKYRIRSRQKWRAMIAAGLPLVGDWLTRGLMLMLAADEFDQQQTTAKNGNNLDENESATSHRAGVELLAYGTWNIGADFESFFRHNISPYFGCEWCHVPQ